MEFGEKLHQLRKQRNLTQEELAQSLFVSRTAVSKWESGRGYPNIDSLKGIAKFFSVTIDELLSGDEVLLFAEQDNKQREIHIRDMVYSLLDISVLMFLFLPLFGQNTEGVVQAVSLFELSGISPWLRTVYYVVVSGAVVWGVLTLSLQNCNKSFWRRLSSMGSLILNGAGVLLFIISSQPYAAALLFIFLMIKLSMYIRK